MHIAFVKQTYTPPLHLLQALQCNQHPPQVRIYCIHNIPCLLPYIHWSGNVNLRKSSLWFLWTNQLWGGENETDTDTFSLLIKILRS